MKQLNLSMMLLALSLANALLAAQAAFPVISASGEPATIVIAKDTGEENHRAAATLAQSIEKITGIRPPIASSPPQDPQVPVIWVAAHDQLAKRFPGQDFTFTRPEEILMVCQGNNLAILGQDTFVEGAQTSFGTANAVFTFIEDKLGVRWLWPGPLGEDVPQKVSILIDPFTYRFAPPFRERKYWRGRYAGEQERQAKDWFRFQRSTLASLKCRGGHAYTDWWEKYHEQYPEIFALQPNGERKPPGRPKDVKLCVSNPKIQELWVAEAKQEFASNPTRIMQSVSPNDGPGFCVCDACRAMDAPDGPPMWGYVALTDRYVKFWNELATNLRRVAPNREAYVGAYAYSAYRTPPVHTKLDPAVAIGYVGHFPMANAEVTAVEKENWLGWAEQASLMFYRPNLFHYSGGWLGFPTLAIHQTADGFRFLADHKCVGLQVDTWPMNWATQGPQHYAMAQLAYDPYQDVEALMEDYYQRGYGPAADAVAAYFTILEQGHEAVLKDIQLSSARGREMVDILAKCFDDQRMAQAESKLLEAEYLAADADPKYSQRLAFLRRGFEYVQLQRQIIKVMRRVRESEGHDTEAIALAEQLCTDREAMHRRADFAVRGADWFYTSRRLQDYMGPPSQALLNSVDQQRLNEEMRGRDAIVE